MQPLFWSVDRSVSLTEKAGGGTLFLLLFSTQFHSEMTHAYPAILSATILPISLISWDNLEDVSTKPQLLHLHSPLLFPGWQTDRPWVYMFLGPEKPPGLVCPGNCTEQAPRPVWDKDRERFPYQQKGWAGHSGKALTPRIINLKVTSGLKPEASRSLKWLLSLLLAQKEMKKQKNSGGEGMNVKDEANHENLIC